MYYLFIFQMCRAEFTWWFAKPIILKENNLKERDFDVIFKYVKTCYHQRNSSFGFCKIQMDLEISLGGI